MLIKNANIISGGKVTQNGYVVIENNIIKEVGRGECPCRPFNKTLDVNSGFLAPGYIDIHTHGAMGYDVMDCTDVALDALCEYHGKNGVVAFCPTTLTAPFADIKKVAQLFLGYKNKKNALPVGLHLEGPMLSRKAAGAQPQAHLTSNTTEFISFLKKIRKAVKIITVAPDVLGITSVIEFCAKNGITVSGGHDCAVDSEVTAAIRAGLTGVTHIFCCSSSISRRDSEPTKHTGITERALLDNRLYTEAVADNCHLPTVLLQLLYKNKGARKIALVSDSIRAAGLSTGSYKLGDSVEIVVTKDVAFLAGQNIFAGSVTPVCKMVENCVAAGIPLQDAVCMATKTPAKAIKLSKFGEIKVGYCGKLNLLDSKGKLKKVIIDE